MKDQLVTFKTALLAKEKGFPHYEDIVDAYHTDGSLGVVFDSSKSYSIPAPTQSLLQRWLREKHNIHIHFNITAYLEWYYCIFELVEGESILGGGGDDKKAFDSYGAALEAALQEALTKNINL